MTKKYNIGSKSDMRRFERDLQKSLDRNIASQVNNLSIDVKCPKCGNTFKASSGSNVCPHCKSEITLNISL